VSAQSRRWPLITIATDHTTSALHSGARVASALTDGFQTAFHVEAGITATAALLALLLLRRGEAAHSGRVGEVAMSSQ
jgi:hypothetical protein